MVKQGESSKQVMKARSDRVASTGLKNENYVKNKIKLEEQEHENEFLLDSW
jgi:hypothetical protein